MRGSSRSASGTCILDGKVRMRLRIELLRWNPKKALANTETQDANIAKAVEGVKNEASARAQLKR